MKMKEMLSLSLFKNRTLQSEVQQTVMGLFLVLVLGYSIALGYYFTAGLSVASNIVLEAVSEFKESTDSGNAKPPFRQSDGVSSSYSYEDLPDNVKKVFPEESIVLGVPEIKFNAHSSNADAHLIFLLAEKLPDGKMVFLTKELSSKDSPSVAGEVNFDLLEHAIFWVGIGILVLVYVIARMMTGRMNRQVAALQQWTDNLDVSNASETLPDFRYDELSNIADRLASSFRRVGDFVDREQSFLRHASHELRTPIATISGNVNLLSKLELTDYQVTFSERIRRACQSTQLIVETLLWLSRENLEAPETEPVNLKTLLESTIEDHRYLLEGKDTSVSTRLTDSIVKLPVVPLSIVLANLVRNAFQHTQTGDIHFEIRSDVIQIRNNAESASLNESDFRKETGIGLSLVQRITNRLDWDLDFTLSEEQVITTLSFPREGLVPPPTELSGCLQEE